MKRLGLQLKIFTQCIILIILLFVCLFPQNFHQEDKIFISRSSTTAGFVTQLLEWPFVPTGNVRSILFGSHRIENTALGFYINVNSNLRFNLKDGQQVIELPDSALLVEQGEIIFPPNFYDIDNPFGLCFSYSFEPFEFFISSRLYTQSETTWRHRLVDVGGNTYYITVESETQRKSEIFLAATGSYSIDEFTFVAGLSGVRLAGWGNMNLQTLRTRPLIRIGLPVFGGNLFGESNMQSIGLSQNFQFTVPFGLEEKKILFATTFASNLNVSEHELFQFDIQIPLHTNIIFTAGYRKVLGGFNQLSEKDFIRWRSEISSLLDGEPISGIEHTAFSAGVIVELDMAEYEFPIVLINSKMFHKNIYCAKKDYYAYNPIGTLDILNQGKKSTFFQVQLELPNHLGSFKSETIKIEPNEVKTVPLFLYLSEEKLHVASRLLQMDIATFSDGRKKLLSTVPVTLYDAHSWDGNTYGLRYFLTPDEPVVQTNAKKKYLLAITADTLLSEPMSKVSRLYVFLSELGKDIHYVQDPTTSLYVDHVQYPIETIELHSGDCEDLVVCFASHLMAVGFQCALVDIKPNSDAVQFPTSGQHQYGHILLLVDTGIESEQANSLNLNEFQFITRSSMNGKKTIWLPIETTILDQGFDKAFNEGVRQYYREVIELNGMKMGTVHVYDF